MDLEDANGAPMRSPSTNLTLVAPYCRSCSHTIALFLTLTLYYTTQSGLIFRTRILYNDGSRCQHGPFRQGLRSRRRHRVLASIEGYGGDCETRWVAEPGVAPPSLSTLTSAISPRFSTSSPWSRAGATANSPPSSPWRCTRCASLTGTHGAAPAAPPLRYRSCARCPWARQPGQRRACREQGGAGAVL